MNFLLINKPVGVVEIGALFIISKPINIFHRFTGIRAQTIESIIFIE